MNEPRPILVIDLNERWAECWACAAPTPCQWGLPVRADTAELADNDYEGEWGGVAACEECFSAHAQGLLTADTLPGWRRRADRERRALQHLVVRG